MVISLFYLFRRCKCITQIFRHSNFVISTIFLLLYRYLLPTYSKMNNIIKYKPAQNTNKALQLNQFYVIIITYYMLPGLSFL